MLIVVLIAATITLIIVAPVVALAVCRVAKQLREEEDKHDR